MAIKKLSSQVLRQHKGVSFPGVTTVFICHDGQGRIVLAKRGPVARDENGHWSVGGGGLKHGQSLDQNVRREILEEYGARAKRVDFIGYKDAFRVLADGTPTHWLAMYFAVLVDPSEVRNNEPQSISELGWYTLDNLPSPMHSMYQPFIKEHGQTLKKFMDIK
jgi:ADP-ribose pyrophosphatase YjhB (NUDIX family)